MYRTPRRAGGSFATPTKARPLPIVTLKATKPLFLSKTLAVMTESESEVDSSSATHEGANEPLLYSPVKTSHDEIIDLTLSSSEDEDGSDYEAEVLDLVDGSLSSSPNPRMKRLIKGFRPLEVLAGLSIQDDTEDDQPYAQSARNDGGDVPPADDTPRKPASRLASTFVCSDSEDEEEPKFPLPLPRPKHKQSSRTHTPLSQPSAPSSSQSETPRGSSPTKKGKTPRVSKKALQAIEQAHREAYAQELFAELNASVFKGGLPENTALSWNNRLLTTAGRARWKKYVTSFQLDVDVLIVYRSRDGSQTTGIELATKILDSDGRCIFRNALRVILRLTYRSHPKHVVSRDVSATFTRTTRATHAYTNCMCGRCHLACWIINGDPKEGHGRAFKAWYVS